jgi:Ca2+-binding EF-hand superfamily protein
MQVSANSSAHYPYQAFDALDIDRSGVINEDKLRQVALEVGVTLTHDEAVAILNQLDRNHKGEVSESRTCSPCDSTTCCAEWR